MSCTWDQNYKSRYLHAPIQLYLHYLSYTSFYCATVPYSKCLCFSFLHVPLPSSYQHLIFFFSTFSWKLLYFPTFYSPAFSIFLPQHSWSFVHIFNSRKFYFIVSLYTLSTKLLLFLQTKYAAILTLIFVDMTYSSSMVSTTLHRTKNRTFVHNFVSQSLEGAFVLISSQFNIFPYYLAVF